MLLEPWTHPLAKPLEFSKNIETQRTETRDSNKAMYCLQLFTKVLIRMDQNKCPKCPLIDKQKVI